MLPGQRIPDAGPLVRVDGSTTSVRELLRAPELQLWVCAGAGTPRGALDIATSFASSVRSRVFVIGDSPPRSGSGVECFAEPTLHVHGRLGAVSDTAYVVRPDGYLGFRCAPADADRLAGHLRAFGIRI